ncbi:MAG: hypothetical protein NT018_04425 [Armatimonadetes bacterium]|nr:hypothetical protein [Armatimonadota bacterium]
MKQYAKDHPDVPYYTKDAISMAGRLAENVGDYKLARECYEKLPAGYEQQEAIKRLDEKMRK